ncbi:MAG: sensor histidine kinase [Phycisphaerales bacterium JB065]
MRPEAQRVLHRFKRVLPRGESTFAVAGLALSGIVVLCGALAVGTAYMQASESRQVAKSQQTRLLGTLLAGTATQHLKSGDLAQLRKTMSDLQQSHELSRVSVELAGGEIIADTTPDRITVNTLPEQFGTLDSSQVASIAIDRFGVPDAVVLRVGDRGEALLRLEGSQNAESPPIAPYLGVMGIVVVGVGVLWIVYRDFRQRLKALGAVGSALRSYSEGERSPEALRVSDAWGPEATIWNVLLEDRTDDLAVAGDEHSGALAEGETIGNLSELAAACDTLWTGMLLVGEDGAIRYANGAAAVLLGMMREDLPGKQLREALDDEALIEAVTTTASGDGLGRSTYEVERIRDESKAYLRVRVGTLSGVPVGCALVTIEDVTQKRVADDAMHSFVAQATHELRTPLTNIRLYIEEAIESGDEDPSLRDKALNIINQESQRLERIVGDMLSVSEIEAGSIRLNHTDIRTEKMLEDLKNDYEAAAEDKQIKLVFDLPPKLPVFTGDRDKVAIAMHNLLGNAIKYTPKKGTVTVKAEEDGDMLRIEFIDSGIGIDPSEHERVFEKFYRASDKRVDSITGSGLGLALAREIVRLHGGDITLDSQVGKGSTFTLTLPAAMRAAA